MNDWQPIETAPKDGSTFLSCNTRQGNVYGITWWSKTYEYWMSTGGQALYQFTHWMPLPDPPSVSLRTIDKILGRQAWAHVQ